MSYAIAPVATQQRIALVAPLSGRLVPIEQVPDPVFAQKMVGDGVSIDPTSQTLCAPCDGEVIQLHPAHHALTIKTAEGLEVLMHIGLDTVTLRGEGFTPHVKVGDRVHAGDPLIEFDADYIATHARSLLTQIVIANSDQVAAFLPQQGSATAGKSVVLELSLNQALDGIEPAVTQPVEGAATVTSEPIAITNSTGLHARPAAVLATLAKQYKSTIRLKLGDKSANVRSLIGVMGMDVAHGALVVLEASGVDAEAAIAALSAALKSGLGETGTPPGAAASPVAPLVLEIPKPLPRPHSDDPNQLLGVTASPGVAVGFLYPVTAPVIDVPQTGDPPSAERDKLAQAIATAKQEIEALQTTVAAQGDPKKAAIFAAHQALLDDPELSDSATDFVAQDKSAAFAWQQAYTVQAEMLAKLDNPLLAERANDLRDVGSRVLRLLTGTRPAPVDYPANTILVATDLTPSDMATLDRAKVVGFCTVGGGATSHVAILARSLDLPALVGIEPRALELPPGTPVILDGSAGTLRLHPSAAEMDDIRQRQARQQERRQLELATAFQPAMTQDGQRIEVVANISNAEDAAKSVTLGGEGVGLLRSELLFMERDTAPSEDEQTELYTAAAKALGDRPLIIRTLDVGGDKPLSYLPLAAETNPFLGIRGIRLGFDHPELLRTQFRAILRAAQAGNVQIMFPMVARLEEWHLAKTMLEAERQALGVAAIPAGIMVEVPSTAVMAEQFAREVDFFSVGTNDLTQYTLAMDRGHPQLAALADALNPGVLGLIGMAARAASQHGKWCGICGGMAGDPQAIPILLGLGITELSVSIPTIPSVKAQIRQLNLADCQALAAQALAMNTAAEVRSLVGSRE